MTLFGFIWLIVIIYGVFRKDIKAMIAITLFFMTFQCTNVLVINDDIGIGPQVLTSIIYIMKSWINRNWKIHIRSIQKNKLGVSSVFLIMLLFTMVSSSVFNGVFSRSYLVILHFAVYVACFMCMQQDAVNMGEKELYGLVRGLVIFVSVFGLIQLGSTMGVLPLRDMMKPIFYNDESMNVYFNWNDLFHNRRIYSTFMEPSYFASFSVGAFYYLLCFKDRIKNNIWLFVILFVSIVISFSSTAYGAFAITGLVFLVTTKELNYKWKLLIVLIALVVAGIFYYGFYYILDEVIFSKSLTGSGIVRARWNKTALNAFLSSPVYGIGYRQVRGSSILYGIMGELGLLGLLFFAGFNLFALWRVVFRVRNNNSMTKGDFGVIYATIAALSCMLIACPDLDLCSYWMWLYLLALYLGTNRIGNTDFQKNNISLN